jgi:CcmD family protein
MRVLMMCGWLLLVPIAVSAQPQPPKDFVAVDETAPGEQIPAMPLIASAYGFIWVVLVGYVWSIGRRLQKVEGELVELESRKTSASREAPGNR